jgi:hypothetical protein
MTEWTPRNPRPAFSLIRDGEIKWTSAAKFFHSCGMDNRIVEEVYEMGKLYTDNREAVYQPLEQFLNFFQEYISDEENNVRITTLAANWLNEGKILPFEICKRLGFE